MAKLTLSSLILLALAFIVVVTVFVFSTVLHDYHTSAGRKSASLRSADMQDAVPKSILVLLQRSVVDNSKQCQRLYGIDETWAKWSTQSPCTIAAVVPKDESCHANQLSRIRLHEIISPNGQPLDPFMNLYLGARSSMAQANTLNWVVLANDHSFFLLDNVVKFLQPLDHRQLIYTGSKLAISYEKEALSFASGGAGAVLSMTALKALLTIWESIHRHQRTVRSEGVLPPRITPNDKIFVARTTRDLEDFSSHAAKLIHAVAFRQQHASFDQVPQVKLSMYISSLYHIELAITEDLSAVVWELHNATHTLSSIEHGKLMALCWPSSKWERDNPGNHHPQ